MNSSKLLVSVRTFEDDMMMAGGGGVEPLNPPTGTPLLFKTRNTATGPLYLPLPLLMKVSFQALVERQIRLSLHYLCASAKK